MDSPSEQDKIAYILGLRKKIERRKRGRSIDYLLLSVLVGGLAFLAFDTVWAGLLFAFLSVSTRAIADELIYHTISLEHGRAMFEYDGDLERLEAALKGETRIAGKNH